MKFAGLVWDHAGETLAVRCQRDGKPICSARHTALDTSRTCPAARRRSDCWASTARRRKASGSISATARSRRVGEAVPARPGRSSPRPSTISGAIVAGSAKANQLSGPIGIAKLSGDVAAVSYLSLLPAGSSHFRKYRAASIFFPFRSSTGATFCTMDSRRFWAGPWEPRPRTWDFGWGWR